jgi:hypothetical protein
MASHCGKTAIIATTLLLAACSNQLPTEAVSSSAQLEKSPTYSDTERYLKPGVDFRKYTIFIIDPADIYQGPEAQFGDVPAQDRTALATFMSQEFTRVIGQKYQIANAPGFNVLRIHLTLAGITETQPALATVTHFVGAGLAMNVVEGATDSGPGSFTGSATYATNFYDSASNELVAVFVTRQGPNAMKLGALFSGLDAAKAGVTDGAEKLVALIDQIQSGR